MSTAVKRLTVAIWTSEAFQGSRNDARRLASLGAAACADLFADSADIFEICDSKAEQMPVDHPDQLTLF